MLQVMLLRILLIIILGSLLFICLLYFIGFHEDGLLKKCKQKKDYFQRNSKAKIILIYLLVLCAGISLYFLLIKHWIRGVV